MALEENIKNILNSAEYEIKSVQVLKNIPLEVDVGNLTATDTNELDKSKFNKSNEEDEVEEEDYLKSLARDGVQILINKIWDLPNEISNNMIYATLPPTTIRLPREKPVPKPKPITKWEAFKNEKGLHKKKKDSKVWDAVLKEWVPQYGYNKVVAEKKKNWMIEVPDNANPYEDQFEKLAEAKSERIAKNEYSRLKNLARAKKVKVPTVGVTSFNTKSQHEMKTALDQTRLSTASLGKFQATLPKEKPLPETKRGQKRKLPSNDNTSAGIQKDKRKALKILNGFKKSELDYESAVNKQIKMDNVEMSHSDKKGKSSGRRSKHGGRQRGKAEYRALSKGIVSGVNARAIKQSKSKTIGGKLRAKSTGGNKGGKQKGKTGGRAGAGAGKKRGKSR